MEQVERVIIEAIATGAILLWLSLWETMLEATAYVPSTMSNNSNLRPLGVGLRDNTEQECEDNNVLDWARKIKRSLDVSRGSRIM